MGLGGISIWQLLIVLVIILLIFGTKKFRNIGGDLGSAVKGFKKAMHEDEDGKVTKDEVKELKKDADFHDEEDGKGTAQAATEQKKETTSDKS